jgi:hypothetical protein
LAENEDDSLRFYLGPSSDYERPLLDSCYDAIAAHPEFVWELIQNREFGIQTNRLRACWIKALSHQPVLIMEKLPEMPWHAQLAAFASIRFQPGDAVSKAHEVLPRFLQHEDPSLREFYLNAYAHYIGWDRLLLRSNSDATPSPYVRPDFKKKIRELETLDPLLRAEVEQRWRSLPR